MWLFPIQRQVLVTDETGGVPVDVCNLPEHVNQELERLTGSRSVLYHFKNWEEATSFADGLVKDKLSGWEVKYDNWVGRSIEFEQRHGDDDRDYDDYEHDIVDEDEDELERAINDCGQIRGGGCTLIGTEYCDWDCPFSRQLFQARDAKGRFTKRS